MPSRSIAAAFRKIAAGVLLSASSAAVAQFVGNDPQAAERRADDLVSKMTLEEKVELIGGDTPFRTHPIARLNIPYFQMADGPVGAHIPAPTIAYAGGIGLAASWIPTSPCASANNSGATPARAARRFCSGLA